MNRRAYWVVVGALLWGVTAVGQDEVAPVPAREPAAAFQPTQDEYVVVAGDTLWAISERVVGKAWLWPRVWALNPEITNPHWIYPGDVIRFFDAGIALPSQSGALNVARQMDIPEGDTDGDGDEDTDTISGPEEEELANRENVPKIELINTAAPPRIGAVEAAEPARVAADWVLFNSMFVTPQELAESGTLTNSADDKMLMASEDLVYIHFPKGQAPQVGSEYMVYRTVKPVEHPVTRKPWGFMTQVTSLAAVERVEDNVAQARLVRAQQEVERGQYVTPMTQEPFVDVLSVPATSAIEGVILDRGPQTGALVGQGDIVFIDKGEAEGVVRGNRFRVYSKRESLMRHERPFDSMVAVLLVVDVKANASTCLVIESIRELDVGNRIVAVTE